MATPTFIAGACFVIVAMLAYGTTQTRLLYSDPACQTASCSNATGGGGSNGVTLKTNARRGIGGKQGSARPGGKVHQPQGAAAPGKSGATAGTKSSTSPTPHASPTPPTSIGGGQPGPDAAILFRTLKTWKGGFTASVTISNHGSSAFEGWQLWLRYRVTGIEHVWNARWFPDSPQAPNAGIVAPPNSQQRVMPGASERFTFRASGILGAPIGCSFDGYTCSFKSLSGGKKKPPPATGSHGKSSGGKGSGGKGSGTGGSGGKKKQA
ncbi:MAG: cellulose binding domain-containing protein [Streptosporangiaceae bacterium]